MINNDLQTFYAIVILCSLMGGLTIIIGLIIHEQGKLGMWLHCKPIMRRSIMSTEVINALMKGGSNE